MYKSLFRIVTALAGASVVCLLLFIYRIYATGGSTTYSWLIIPNLCLAWVPLVFSVCVRLWWDRNRRLNAGMVILLALWLLFLPNAPYVTTDLVHLTYLKSNMPIHYDVLLNGFTAITALLAGFLSIFLVHEMMIAKLRSAISWIQIMILLLLCSIGVFLGRFLRWNSWDIFQKPVAIIQDSLALIEQRDSLLFIGTFMLYMSFLYVIFYFCVQLRANEERK
jgi:uncharacterized membrane protein